MKQLVLIDGMGFVFRAYHAVRGLTRARDGLPVNALFGFSQMLLKVVTDLKPDQCVMVLDSKGPNWRHALYPAYKANREAPDEALVRQLPYLEPLVAAFGLPLLRQAGVEADDLIASAVREAVAAGEAVTIRIVTSDKDLLQLVRDGTPDCPVTVQLVDTLQDKISGPQACVDKFGVPPAQVPEVQGLMGDSSDNIPGIAGVGPKTAGELIRQFGTLEALYERVDEVGRETLRAKLLAGRDAAFLSRDLARLKDDVVLDKTGWGFHPALHQAAEYLRNELEFGTLARRLETRPTPPPPSSGGGDRFETLRLAPVAVTDNPGASAEAWGNYEAVLTLERWAWWLAEARRVGRVAIDTETTSLNPLEARLVGISLCVGVGKACYVPVAAPGVGREADLFGEPTVNGPHGVVGLDVREGLRALLADPAVCKIAHNLKYDWQVLARYCGILPLPDERGEAALMGLVVNYEDTLLMSACLQPSRGGHGLDALALAHLGHTMIGYKDVVGTGKAAVTFDAVPLERAVAYAAEDADACWRIYEILQRHSSPQTQFGPWYVYASIERPLLPVVVGMEARGVRVDIPFLNHLSAQMAADMAVLEQNITAMAGRAFNVQSTQQLAVVLFDEMGAGTERQRKSRSTAVDVLEEIVASEGMAAPLAALMLTYRGHQKLRSTYAAALPEQVLPLTGRVHTHYQQVGAATGRFSSSDPNLQNIPIRTAEGRKIREAFVPRDGWVMVSADYSQIELRLLAHLSGSTALQAAFAAGVDIHAYTAHLVNNVPLDAVTKEQRRAAKFVNFGLVYGMGARSLAGQIGCSITDAQAWIAAYFARYDGVRDYMEANKKKAKEKGYVETLMGRRVWLPEIASAHAGLRAGAERAAINAPLQGSNADIIKLAMPKIAAAIGHMPAHLLMQVHDELVLECAPEVVETLRTTLPQVMGGVVTLRVPLLAEVGVGPNWDAAH
jgi:DNA polymerase-1